MMLATAASVLLACGLAFVTLSEWSASQPVAAQLAHRVNTVEYYRADGDWRSPTAAEPFLAGDRLRIAQGSYATVTMSGGTVLRLDEDTQMRFVDDDTVYLDRGAVYAEAPGASTLTVETAAGTARDIGTRFEVRIVDAGWQVQVREGRVIVNDNVAGEAFADAGERLRIAAGDEVSREEVGPADASWQWTQAALKPMAIEGVALSDYLAWWSRESGIEVHYQRAIDEALSAQTLLHGSIARMTLDEGFRVVISSSGYQVVDLNADRVMLTR
jgi:hypothetical protein